MVQLNALSKSDSVCGVIQRSKFNVKWRPECFDDWLARSRNVRFTPTIHKDSGIQDSWWKWWTSNQPKWRIDRKSKNLLRDDSGDVSSVCIGGQSGLIEFIMVLSWWRTAIQQDERWSDAINDVCWVLNRKVQGEIDIDFSINAGLKCLSSLSTEP